MLSYVSALSTSLKILLKVFFNSSIPYLVTALVATTVTSGYLSLNFFKLSSLFTLSILFAITILLLLNNFSLYAFTSFKRVSYSSNTSLPSYSLISSTYAITLLLLACFKNLSPSPTPLLAPSIIPGKSATTKLLSFILTTPKFGVKVV